jgi:hypothetical protein
MNLPEYYKCMKADFMQIKPVCPKGTPYRDLGDEIVEMIRSYISDSEFFAHQDDPVNQFASLCYAHGWMSEGIHMGVLTGFSSVNNYSDFHYPDRYNQGHLNEKTLRYFQMLKKALQSIDLAPASGSPVMKCARYCIRSSENTLVLAENLILENRLFPALGLLSNSYGRLDCAVRAGLIKIICEPELFTTEP